MKTTSSKILNNLVFAVLLLFIVFILNSLRHSLVIGIYGEQVTSNVWNYFVGGFQEEVARAIIGGYFVLLINNNKYSVGKVTLFAVFSALVFTFVEQNAFIKHQYFLLQSLSFVGDPKYLIISSVLFSTMLHFCLHAGLLFLSLIFFLEKRFVCLLLIALFHGIINIVMSLTPVFDGIFETYYLNTAAKFFLFVALMIGFTLSRKHFSWNNAD